MCKEFEIARSVAVNFILHKEVFTLDDLLKKIDESGGEYRVSNYQTVKDFLDSYVEKGYLSTSTRNDQYKRASI